MKKGFLLLLAVFSFQYLLAQGQDLVPKQKKNKWGYSKTNSNKFAIKAKFDVALPFGKMLDSNRAFVKSTNYGVIDTKGKWLIKPNYDTIFEQKKINEWFLLAKKGQETFILNKKGEIISEGFSSLEPLNKEVFIFSKNKQLGLMLRKNEKYEIILPAEYRNLGVANFKNTLFYARKDNKVKFYDLNTKKFSEEYDNYANIKIRDTSEIRSTKSYLVVEKNNKKGLIDEKLNLILNLEYNQINRFRTTENEVLFEVSKNGKKGLLNEKAQVVLPIEFDVIYYTQPYFVAFKDNFFGCYDPQGKQILSHLYEDIRLWKEQNVFLVTKEKLQGIVSKEEKIILPILYSNLMRITYDTPCFILATKPKEKEILMFENNKIEKIHTENYEDLRQAELNPIKLIGKLKSKENVYVLENKKLKKLFKNDYDKIEMFNAEYYWVRNKAKNYFLEKNTEKLILLPQYTLLKDGEETYQVDRRERKKYAEGQEEGTFYLEQEDKAFFWNVKTQKLSPTEKIVPFEKGNRKEQVISKPKNKSNNEKKTNKPRKK